MDTWFSYELADLLMFSPQVYYRQIELANHDIWPGQLLAVAGGLLLALCIGFPTAVRSRVAAAVLAVAWFCSGWVFIASRFADIHIAGPYMEALFFFQGAALTGFAVTSNGLDLCTRSKAVAGTMALLIVAVVVVYPSLALFSGRVFAGAEVFGVAADPTALATLLVISGAASGRRLWLAVVPVFWLGFSAATLSAMESAEAAFVLSGLFLAATILVLRWLRNHLSRAGNPD